MTSPELGNSGEQAPHRGDEILALLDYSAHAEREINGVPLRDFMRDYDQPFFVDAIEGLRQLQAAQDPRFAQMQQYLQTTMEYYLNRPTPDA